MKRIIAVVLTIAVFWAVATPAYAVEPRYTNASSATVTFTISDSGVAKVLVRMTGSSSLSKSSVCTYIEKKVGSTWTRVNIGTTNNEWDYTTTSTTIVKTYTSQLSSTGEYRAVCEMTLTESTTETITQTATATY